MRLAENNGLHVRIDCCSGPQHSRPYAEEGARRERAEKLTSSIEEPAPERARLERLQERLRAGLAIDVRGHGKAGGGLILAMQSFGAAIAMNPADGRTGLAALLLGAQGRQRLRLHADCRRPGRDGLPGDRAGHRAS